NNSFDSILTIRNHIAKPAADLLADRASPVLSFRHQGVIPPMAAHSHPHPATVGQLKETGYRPMSVKDELRKNLIRKLKAGEELFSGVLGYRDSVIPQIVNGI